MWLYVPLSEARLRMVRSGGMTLRSAFVEAEGFVYVVRLAVDNDESDVAEPIPPTALSDSWLPEPDFRLSLPTQTLESLEAEDIFAQRAVQESRTRVRLRVELPNYTRNEAPTRQVGELLVTTQGVYDNIGLALASDDPPQRGMIPQEVSQETASTVVAMGAGSYVIDIAANRLDDLFGGSLFVRTTQELLALLDSQLDRDGLASRLERLQVRGAKSFRTFVTGLANTGGDVTLAAGGRAFGYIQRDLPSEQLQTLRAILTNLVPDEVVREVRGRMRLYAADLERRIFSLRDEANQRDYEGRFDEPVLAQVNHAVLNEFYDVLVLESRVLDEVIGETKTTYSLSQLVPVPSS